MATLLRGHTHLQAEFWVFFEELRPPPARPGQFEETHWPEDGGGGSDGAEGVSQVPGSGASGGFEEVTLPEEEEEGLKIQPMSSRRQRRKMDAHRNFKLSDWPCLCRDAKIRSHRRKGCSRCHGNKTSGGVSRAMKSLDPLYSQISSAHLKGDDDSLQPDQSSASWVTLTDEKEEEEEELEEEDDDDEDERRSSEKEQSPAVKRSRREEVLPPITTSSAPLTTSSDPPTTSCHPPTTSSDPLTTSSDLLTISSDPPTISSDPTKSSSVTPTSSMTFHTLISTSSSSAPPRPSPPPDPPVCAKNISLTASGEKVILWTREADRVILTTCQQEGANQNTFQAISTLLGNKTPSEVSRRFRDLMRLFRTAARQTFEDEAPPPKPAVSNEEED